MYRQFCSVFIWDVGTLFGFRITKAEKGTPRGFVRLSFCILQLLFSIGVCFSRILSTLTLSQEKYPVTGYLLNVICRPWVPRHQSENQRQGKWKWKWMSGNVDNGLFAPSVTFVTDLRSDFMDKPQTQTNRSSLSGNCYCC